MHQVLIKCINARTILITAYRASVAYSDRLQCVTVLHLRFEYVTVLLWRSAEATSGHALQRNSRQISAANAAAAGVRMLRTSRIEHDVANGGVVLGGLLWNSRPQKMSTSQLLCVECVHSVCVQIGAYISHSRPTTTIEKYRYICCHKTLI